MNPPLISVIVPTWNRPALAVRAAMSALSQTFTEIEVIVVIDGNHQETAEALRFIDDPRLKTIRLSNHRGNAGARNEGIRASLAEWIALLDDDDLWIPSKLELQYAVASRHSSSNIITACRYIVRDEYRETVWPLRYPRDNETIVDYTFSRERLRPGEGVLISSSLLIPRKLLLQTSFHEGLNSHVDHDWLIRAFRKTPFTLMFPATDKPLAVWNNEMKRSRISTNRSWKTSLAWIASHRAYIGKINYAAFVLTEVGYLAATAHAWEGFFPILYDAIRRGKPHFHHIMVYSALWGTPWKLLRKIAGKNLIERDNRHL